MDFRTILLRTPVRDPGWRPVRPRAHLAAASVLIFGVIPGCAPDPVKPSARASPALPNVLLLTLDTLRPDHIEAAMPGLSARLAGGASFSHVLASGCWTYHTMPTLLSGRLMVDMGPEVYATGVTSAPDDELFLAEILTSHGYQSYTASANPMASAGSNLVQGYVGSTDRESAAELMADAEQWLEDWDNAGRTSPLFLHLHAMEPHSPWGASLHPSCEADARAAAADCQARSGYDFATANDIDANVLLGAWTTETRDQCASAVGQLYACALRKLDEEIGQIDPLLERFGVLDQTLVVVATDHGELLGPNLYGHNVGQFWDLTRAMMGFSGLEIAPRVVTRPVSQADLVPTLLGVLGLDGGDTVTGVDLLAGADEALPRSDLRSYWCSETGIESHAWIAEDRSKYVRLDRSAIGSLFWVVSEPDVAGSDTVVEEAEVPAEAREVILQQQAQTAGYCAPGGGAALR